MFLNIDGNYFLDLKGISHVLSHKEEISELNVEDEIICGKISLNLDYFTNESEEFKSNNFIIDFEIIKNKNHELKKLDISQFEFNVIDNNGLDISYQLKLDIIKHKETKNDNKKNEENKNDNEKDKDDVSDLSQEEFKNLIEEEIDQKLEKALESRSEVIDKLEELLEKEDINIRVEEEKEEGKKEIEKEEVLKNINIINEENNERINYNFNDEYQSYKIVYPTNERDLEDVSKKYHKSIDQIYKDSKYKVGDVIIIKND